MKKFLCLIVAFILCLACVGCGGQDETSGAVRLSFKSASGYDYLKSISGQTVEIKGYLAESSPADGSFIFLMNLPYQSCPFCVPNTSQLSNTIEVYPKSGEKFAYTTAAVKVTGKLEVAPSESESFTDDYGYSFNFRIVDAEYKVVKSEELSEDMAVWQQIAESDIVSDLYSMFDYVNFVCKWPTYFCNSTTDVDGNVYPGYYLYASDALNFLKKENAQYSYGYAEGYFDDLLKRAEKIDSARMDDIEEIIKKCKTIAETCVDALEEGEYTSEKQYVEKFGTEDYIFTFPTGDTQYTQFEALYTAFSNWIAGWEM